MSGGPLLGRSSPRPVVAEHAGRGLPGRSAPGRQGVVRFGRGSVVGSGEHGDGGRDGGGLALDPPSRTTRGRIRGAAGPALGAAVRGEPHARPGKERRDGHRGDGAAGRGPGGASVRLRRPDTGPQRRGQRTDADDDSEVRGRGRGPAGLPGGAAGFGLLPEPADPRVGVPAGKTTGEGQVGERRGTGAPGEAVPIAGMASGEIPPPGWKAAPNPRWLRAGPPTKVAAGTIASAELELSVPREAADAKGARTCASI